MKDQEQLVRIVKPFGNGAHIFVPKDWTGEQIVLVRPKKASLHEKILSALNEHLDSVVGVYLYGSHARGDQKPDSDIDLFVVTNKKVNIRSAGFEIICLEEKEIGKAIKLEPVLMYSLLSEAKPIINSLLLDQLQNKYKPKSEDFKEYIKDCKRIIKVNEDFLKEGKVSEAVIYSIVLRLRGVFIIKCLINKQQYNYKLFTGWIKHNLPNLPFNQIYEAYRSSKNEKKLKHSFKHTDIQSLLDLLKKETLKLEND